MRFGGSVRLNQSENSVACGLLQIPLQKQQNFYRRLRGTSHGKGVADVMNSGGANRGSRAMPITGITISAVEPFADNKPYGDAGPYVRIRGVAHGVLDPRAPENAGICDLDKAARSAADLVEYATDFFILRPAEPRRGSGILVYDVTNRGAKRILSLIDDVPANDPIAVNDPKTARDAGLGFLLGRGHSIILSGWDPGAPRANNGLGADFPVALENGKPITGRIRDEFHVGTRGPAELG